MYFILGLCRGPLIENTKDYIHVLDWSSASIKRVVRSSAQLIYTRATASEE